MLSWAWDLSASPPSWWLLGLIIFGEPDLEHSLDQIIEDAVHVDHGLGRLPAWIFLRAPATANAGPGHARARVFLHGAGLATPSTESARWANARNPRLSALASAARLETQLGAVGHAVDRHGRNQPPLAGGAFGPLGRRCAWSASRRLPSAFGVKSWSANARWLAAARCQISRCAGSSGAGIRSKASARALSALAMSSNSSYERSIFMAFSSQCQGARRAPCLGSSGSGARLSRSRHQAGLRLWRARLRG